MWCAYPRDDVNSAAEGIQNACGRFAKQKKNTSRILLEE
jgi:hypothetical protein